MYKCQDKCHLQFVSQQQNSQFEKFVKFQCWHKTILDHDHCDDEGSSGSSSNSAYRLRGCVERCGGRVTMVVRRRPGGGCAFALVLSMALAVVGGAAATAAATEETSSHAPPWLLSDDGLIGDCTNDGNTGVLAQGPPILHNHTYQPTHAVGCADCEQLTFDKCAACCDCQVINCGCNDDCLQDATRQVCPSCAKQQPTLACLLHQ